MNTPALPVTSEPSRRKRILVVDDDDAVRLGLDDVLVAKGYEVVTASNGIQALAALRRQPCDLALLDMNMPLLNGWGTIGELRRLNRWLPMIIITARPDQGTLARESGVELMEKPLDLPLLLRRIGALLNPPHDTTRARPGESAAA
jgi:DNA-binding response OmpR family regulator